MRIFDENYSVSNRLKSSGTPSEIVKTLRLILLINPHNTDPLPIELFQSSGRGVSIDFEDPP
jgi:hypothetical protein